MSQTQTVHSSSLPLTLRTAYEGKRGHAITAFQKGGAVEELLSSLTEATDALIQSLCKNAPDKIAIIATGGYGRQELFPFSDIDLLFLHASDARQETAKIAEHVLYALWDLGLKVGQATRSLKEASQFAESDMTIRTNLLDARFLAGSKPLYAQMERQLKKEVFGTREMEFVDAKLKERDDRHKRLGDSRHLLEPNIKDGKGGLRDLHTLYWLARDVYGVKSVRELVTRKLITEEEFTAFRESEHFLWTMRAHLHLAAGKPEERLTFNMQQTLAPLMGYKAHAGTQAVERMMKHYFLTAIRVGTATRIFCALLEEEKKRKPVRPLGWLLKAPPMVGGFTLDGERLNVADATEFERNPIRMLELFATAQEHELDIHPRALQLVTRSLQCIDREMLKDRTANELFLSILLSAKGPEITLKRMNEVGLLGKFIPDFGRIVGQMQFNMYHIYTVDEHILVALGILYQLEQGTLKEDLPLATDVIKRIKQRKVLYMGLLCHDIAKGRGTDHSETGAEIARKLANRFGYTKDEADTVAWLVKEHLIFTDTAFKRDLNDPKTITDFVNKAKSSERLRLLLCLTVADVRAVGPTVWNGWKGALLRELFTKANTYINTGQLTDAAESREALFKDLHSCLPGWKEAEVETYLDLGHSAFHASADATMHARIGIMLKELIHGEPLVIDKQHDAFKGITQVCVCTPDQAGLFSKLAGAFSAAGANIVSAKIFTLKNGVAVDMFQIQSTDGQIFDKPDKLARLSVKLTHAIMGTLDVAAELKAFKPTYPSRKDALKVPGQVFIENDVSAVHTVIEVNGRDRIGFLHDVTRALAELGLTIVSAHISTYGEQAVDVFYVKDSFGFKITHTQKLVQIRVRLNEIVNAA